LRPARPPAGFAAFVGLGRVLFEHDVMIEAFMPAAHRAKKTAGVGKCRFFSESRRETGEWAGAEIQIA